MDISYDHTTDISDCMFECGSDASDFEALFLDDDNPEQWGHFEPSSPLENFDVDSLLAGLPALPGGCGDDMPRENSTLPSSHDAFRHVDTSTACSMQFEDSHNSPFSPFSSTVRYRPRIADREVLRKFEERSWILRRTQAEEAAAAQRQAIQCNNKRAIDARWPEYLLQMPIKQLNQFIRSRGAGIKAADAKELKAARRRYHSRMYSLTNRIKKQVYGSVTSSHSQCGDLESCSDADSVYAPS